MWDVASTGHGTCTSPLISSFSFICQPTQVCLDDTQEFDRTYEQCCPGFAPRAPQRNTYSQYYHYGYYTPLKSDPLGCPVGKTWGNTENTFKAAC